MTLFEIDESFVEEEDTPPLYGTPGRILVELINMPSDSIYKCEIEVHDYDGDSSVYWINEGIGFDYWFDRHVDFPCLGWHVVEGIIGHYHRGTWGFDDDDESWEYSCIRPATVLEMKTGTLDDRII